MFQRSSRRLFTTLFISPNTSSGLSSSSSIPVTQCVQFSTANSSSASIPSNYPLASTNESHEISEHTNVNGRSMPIYREGYYYNPWKAYWGSWSRLDQLKLVAQWRKERKQHECDPFKPNRNILQLANAEAKTNHQTPQSHLQHNLLDVTLPVLKPNFANFIDAKQINACWIGHATSLVNLHGLTILTDPWFSERTAPVQFLGPRRFRPTPCSVHELPDLDVILISHNHYDHTDYNTIRALKEKLQKQFETTGRVGYFYVPL